MDWQFRCAALLAGYAERERLQIAGNCPNIPLNVPTLEKQVKTGKRERGVIREKETVLFIFAKPFYVAWIEEEISREDGKMLIIALALT